MQTLQDVIDAANGIAEEYVATLMECKPKTLGLDPRAAHTLYVSEEVIGVDINQDRSLQYYGGFEYVDTEHRFQLGSYVFYSSESNRVRDHLDRIEELTETEEQYD